MVWLGKFFFAWSHTADELYIKVHKRKEKVRGGECIDVRRNYNVAAIKVNCLHVIRGVFILPILLKNIA
jgi:hypothetical protein